MPRSRSETKVGKRRAPKRSPLRTRTPALAPAWIDLSVGELLKLRLCDLGLKIEGTTLEKRIHRLFGELERQDLRFRPYFWLSTDWFTPDGLAGAAIPFYLAHPRLMRLERREMLDVEGGRVESCMRLLRHETGHAICNAYRLHRSRRWQRVFGKFSDPYPQNYRTKPYSKHFVLHLDHWYAQSHPAEDFAETFAVWLTPKSAWRERYAGWPALKKLEFVDGLMHELRAEKPLIRSRERFESLQSNRASLAEHYERRRRHCAADGPKVYDQDLQQLFSDRPEHTTKESGAAFLRRVRPELRKLVARWTGEYHYTIDEVLRGMIARCRELKLRVHRPEHRVQLETGILLTLQTMNHLHGGSHRVMR